MKKYLKIQSLIMLLVVLIAGFSISCGDDKDVPDPNKGGNLNAELKVAEEVLSFVNTTSDSAMIHITSNIAWRIDATAEWCRFSKYSGEGNDSVMVFVGENDQLNKRSAEIVISGLKEPVKIPVVQFGRDVEFLTFVGGEEVTNDTVDMDFESYIYNFTFLSNVPFSATLDPTAKNRWIQEQPMDDSEGASTYPGYSKGRWIQVKVSDNEEKEDRICYYALAHTGGEKKDTIFIRQQAYEHFLRFFADTIYIGSHYRIMSLQGRGDVDWKFEFLDDDNKLTATPDWLIDPHKKNPPTKALGTPQVLRAGVKTNESNTARHCKVRFYFNNGKQDMENIITVIQLPNNPWKSDSLVLMKIAEMNAPEVGLNVQWTLGKPMEEWGNIGWSYDDQGNKRIDRLILGNVGMVNELTADVANLSELWDLTLAANFLSGALPEELGMLDKLQLLDITDNYNDVYDYGPENAGVTDIPEAIFTGCKELKLLKASKNRLTKIPEGIQELKNLMELDVSGNKITEFPFEVMGALKSLQVLHLSSNPYSGKFPEFIFELPLLEKIQLDRLDFQGNAIPDRFGSLPLLTTFSANFSRIGGVLPASMASCKGLKSIGLDADDKEDTYRIGGTLPVEWGSLDNLQIIGLSNNAITGSIPVEWAHLLNLWDRTNDRFLGFFVNGNLMSGEIPAAILESPCWDGRKEDRPNPLKGGRIENVSIGSLDPQLYICPQRGEAGFTNCSKK